MHHNARNHRFGVPDHTRATVARLAAVHPSGPIAAGVFAQRARLGHAACLRWQAGAHGFLHRRVHRVELMVARDDLVQRARVRVFLEDDEMLEQIEEALPVEHPAHQRLQLQRGLRRIVLANADEKDLPANSGSRSPDNIKVFFANCRLATFSDLGRIGGLVS